MAVAWASPPLPPPPPPTQLKFSPQSKRRCSCSSALSQSDSISSPPTTTTSTAFRPAVILPVSPLSLSLSKLNPSCATLSNSWMIFKCNKLVSVRVQFSNLCLNFLQGLGNNTNDYDKLALILKDYGVPTVTANVSRIDWLRNAAGLLDSNYWRGTLRPRPVLDWLYTLTTPFSYAEFLSRRSIRV